MREGGAASAGRAGSWGAAHGRREESKKWVRGIACSRSAALTSDATRASKQTHGSRDCPPLVHGPVEGETHRSAGDPARLS